MRYMNFYAGLPGVKPGFMIVVADEPLAWWSEPPGHDLEEPLGPTYFTREDGALGGGKNFEVFPGGRVREVS